jgi:DNA-binding LacI/PurR family transcriptional regulator
MPTSRPSLTTIARAAGVSAMTVSRALRGGGEVAAETSERIRRIADRLGYRPNPLVQALMEQVREKRVQDGGTVIAWLLPKVDEPGWGRQEWLRRLAQGATARARSGGFRLEIVAWQRAEMADSRLDQILKSRGIRGVVVGPLARAGETVRLDWSHYAAAATGASLAGPRLHRVRHHAYHSVQLALEQLRLAGRKRIGLVLSRQSATRVDFFWQAGFLLAPREAPYGERVDLIHEPDVVERDAFLRWVRRMQPDGLMFLEPRVYPWLREAGIAIPETIALADLNRGSEPVEMAGVDQELEAVGAAAADLVIEQLYRNETGVPARPKDVLIEGIWVPGRTAAGQAV